MFRALERLVDRLADLFVWTAAAVLAAMAVLGTADVLLFNLGGRSIPAANEMAATMLPLVVILAMAEAQRRGGHIRVDLLAPRLPAGLHRPLAVLALATGTAVFALFAAGAWELALKSLAVSERAIAAVRFPVWPVKLAFATGATLVAAQLALQLAACLGAGGRQGRR